VKSFDILLVLGYFRSATAYLSIIRHLSGEFRIGILPLETDCSLQNKTGEAQALFLQLCTQFGAQIVEQGQPVLARLMLIQQFPYSDALVARLLDSVSASRKIGLMTLAMAGIEQHDRFVDQFKIRQVYVPSRRFMRFLLEKRQAQARYEGVEIIEIGLPFGKYPIFPEFQVDWLIAAPTLFSFRSESGKHDFLKTVLALLDKIPESESVVYKSHNGNVLDYFAPRYHYALARLISRMPGAEKVVASLQLYFPRFLWVHFSRVITGVLHLQVLHRARPMQEVTPYADISLEAFLPGVQKGVIGGLSNTIWGALFFNLPFLNCVDINSRSNEQSAFLSKDPTNLLDLNLQYFGVPFCAGDITEAAYGLGVVSDLDRQGDLIQTIRHVLAKDS